MQVNASSYASTPLVRTIAHADPATSRQMQRIAATRMSAPMAYTNVTGMPTAQILKVDIIVLAAKDLLEMGRSALIWMNVPLVHTIAMLMHNVGIQ